MPNKRQSGEVKADSFDEICSVVQWCRRGEETLNLKLENSRKDATSDASDEDPYDRPKVK